MSMNPRPDSVREVLKLKQPMSVAIYDDYTDAARAVDYLAERQFPVENLAIVGTDLKSIEKVTGSMTWGKALLGGFLRGTTWAGLFAILVYLLRPELNLLTALLVGLAGFGLAGMALAALQYRSRQGERDYTSTIRIIASHYEVLSEASVVERARHLLTGGGAHRTREVARQPASPGPGASSITQSVDLAALPPPFGQTPRPAAAGIPGPGGPDGRAPAAGADQPPGTGTSQATADPVGQHPDGGPANAAATNGDSALRPYGQYWGTGDPPGIGDPPGGA